jgi:hypothetical protein
MNVLLVACLAVATPLVGIGIFNVQNQLECWDQQKHAQD